MTTPRQELIQMAAAKLRMWRLNLTILVNNKGRGRPPSAHDALEAVVDGAIGGAMLDYYRSVSEAGLDRLIYAVYDEAGWEDEAFRLSQSRAEQISWKRTRRW